jgi:hypothetical protein
VLYDRDIQEALEMLQSSAASIERQCQVMEQQMQALDYIRSRSKDLEEQRSILLPSADDSQQITVDYIEQASTEVGLMSSLLF